jgi:hypothetical protein
MNILDAVGVCLPCLSCGDNYRVPLRDVLLSHRMIHEGCPVSQETECPQVFQSRLFERKDIENLEHVWSQLENRARADGGELVLMGALDSAGQQPVPMSVAAGTAQRPGPSAPLTVVSDQHPRKNPIPEKGESKKKQKRVRTKSVEAKRKRTA